MARRKTKTSLQDIAEKLDISKNAVSLALNGRPGVGVELRKQILATASELNYQAVPRPDQIESKNFLALIPEHLLGDNPLYTHIFWGIEFRLKELGHHVMISSVSASMSASGIIPQVFKSIRFSGILLIGPLSAAYVGSVVKAGLPLVSVDNVPDGIPVHSVVTANEEGSRQVVEYLCSTGHRDIAFVGNIDGNENYFQRWCGYRRALRGVGIAADENMVIFDDLDSEAEPGRLRSAIGRMPRMPQAFFCASDIVAFKLISTLFSMGLRVPEDVSVAGFDDIQASHLSTPGLTTYRAPRMEMGREAASCLTRIVENTDLAEVPMKRTLYGSLQIRNSVLRRAN